ncbi:arylsulfatase [Verrucomicrobiaceae bacterium N1E253]|uniref:Arylsulfatase n=2 Tax=Oceaniferula marina TaxID=2748318 RepID=A0A851GBZ5_9BACT|nr:arylsulfatase [Oceaniferula marina]
MKIDLISHICNHLMLGLTIGFALLMDSTMASVLPKTDQPNIIIIMTDDMGFSDLGCYGSEIKTPHLDTLAHKGIRFTRFYNTGRCCPTRASLLTGLYQHQAGVGNMTNDAGPSKPGYRGRLMERCVTIAEVLGQGGYRTIQTGKWHVGDKKKEWLPSGRGFDRNYSCPQGGGFYFRPSAFKKERHVVRGNEVLYNKQKDPPEGWYATDAWTDEGLKYVREAVEEKKPFLWYLAHNAPHYPLKAKPEDIAKYRGKYKIGWDAIRQQRYEKLIKLGIIDPKWKLSTREKGIPAWDSLSEKQKDEQDLRMATYAAMIDCVDQNVGKIVATLKQLEVYENTLILFLHDNGGCAEGGTMGRNTGKGICGTAESFALYGACWANVSDTPFRKYKKFIHEGGISSPLIAHWPKGINAKLNGKLTSEPTHLIDLMATCVDLSGSSYPESFKGNEIIPMEGVSLNPIFQGKQFKRNAPLFFEHVGNRGIRYGKWKLVAVKGKPWELYDMQADRTERNNMAKELPEKVKELTNLYKAWAERSFVTKNMNFIKYDEFKSPIINPLSTHYQLIINSLSTHYQLIINP